MAAVADNFRYRPAVYEGTGLVIHETEIQTAERQHAEDSAPAMVQEKQTDGAVIHSPAFLFSLAIRAVWSFIANAWWQGTEVTHLTSQYVYGWTFENWVKLDATTVCELKLWQNCTKAKIPQLGTMIWAKISKIDLFLNKSAVGQCRSVQTKQRFHFAISHSTPSVCAQFTSSFSLLFSKSTVEFVASVASSYEGTVMITGAGPMGGITFTSTISLVSNDKVIASS